MNFRWLFFFILGFLFHPDGLIWAQPAQYSVANAHSHNDYEQSLPFYNAYARHFGSIEADLWAVKDTLYVAHDRNQIAPGHRFSDLYLHPLINRLKTNNGHAYRNGRSLQLLIDLKSSYEEVMPLLIQELQAYRKYFDIEHNPDAVRIVISGAMPPPDSLHFFERIFTFDGRLGNRYPDEDLQRVELVSANVQEIVSWKDQNTLNETQQHTLRHVIDSLHHKNKLVRFWATPNNNQTYRTLIDLGVDYIGTDKLPRLECFLRSREED